MPNEWTVSCLGNIGYCLLPWDAVWNAGWIKLTAVMGKLLPFCSFLAQTLETSIAFIFWLRHKSKLFKWGLSPTRYFCLGRNNQTCSFWITDIISSYCQESQSHFAPARGEIFTSPSEAESSSRQRPRYGNRMLITVNTSAGSHTLD